AIAGTNITASNGVLSAADTQPLTTEQVQDIVGGMVTGNTETNIAVTYEDGDGTLDFVVTDTNTTYSAGTDLDLNGTTFSLEPALDSVVTMYNDSLKIGRADGQDSIDFGSDDTILFDIDNTERMRVDAAGVDITGNLSVTGDTTVVNILAGAVSNSIQFEGSTADEYETTLSVIDPTEDRTINLPNASGTVSLSDTNTTYSAGSLLDLSGTTFHVDLTEAAEAAITVADDYVLFLDGGATGTQSKEKWADVASAIAGTNITASNGVLSAADTQPLTTEQVQDIVGGMVTGNTETNIAVTYQDGDGTLDFVATDTNTNQLTTFTLAGDSGSSQTIAQGNTLTVAGGTGLDSVASATDTITLNIDATVCTLTGTQTLTNKTIDAGAYTT
ncbi:MAG: hypothetical protein QF535_04935, partial [Anaerolineales bacterium]|nr:hypothetical protein [Anaerolineales bacterium]